MNGFWGRGVAVIRNWWYRNRPPAVINVANIDRNKAKPSIVRVIRVVRVRHRRRNDDQHSLAEFDGRKFASN